MTIDEHRDAAENLSDVPCLCWDFGDGDEHPHFKDANGLCTPFSRAVQE